jgi:negative elongation factor B
MLIVLCVEYSREHPSVKELMRLIGDNLQLYNVCLGLLRSLFIQDGQPLPCMLRFDLLMAMHDADVKQVDNYMHLGY